MLPRTPGLSRSSSLSGDLAGACFFFAISKAFPNFTPEEMNRLIHEGIQSPLLQKLHERKRKKGTLFSNKVQDRKVKEAEESQYFEGEMDWRYTYVRGRDEFWCTYTKCGICRLAQREHMERYLPCMCKMDYETYPMIGAKLIRTKTLANGDDAVISM